MVKIGMILSPATGIHYPLRKKVIKISLAPTLKPDFYRLLSLFKLALSRDSR